MTKRLRILSDSEIIGLYGPPVFSQEDREHYFDLSPLEESVFGTINVYVSKVYFIIQLGYFKATQQFCRTLNKDDIDYIHDKYFSTFKKSSHVSLSKPTYTAINQKILDVLGYCVCTPAIKYKLKILVKTAVRIDSKPLFLFKELVHFMQKNRIVLPGYSYLQELIGATISYEEQRLQKIIEENITAFLKESFNKLLQTTSTLHEITIIKKEPKSFALNQMIEEAKKLQQLKPLYFSIKELLTLLKISEASVQHYCDLVDYYTVYKIKRLPKFKAFLYVLCFLYRRFRKTNDNLIEAFIMRVNKYCKEAKFSSQETAKTYQLACNDKLKQAAKMLTLFTQKNLDNLLFKKIKEKAFKILSEESLKNMIAYLKKQKIDVQALEWEYYDKISLIFKRNIRPLFLQLEFTTNTSLSEHINFLKEHLESRKTLQDFPIESIAKTMQNYLFGSDLKSKKINANKYEFMVYQQIRNAIEAGHCFVRESKCYRSFEDDLVDEQTWNNRAQVLQNLGLQRLLTPIKTLLNDLKHELEDRIKVANQRIQDKSNQYIKKKGSKWILPYPSIETTNHILYQQLPIINIGDLLLDNHNYCEFLNAFFHVMPRYQKQDLDQKVLIACIIAFGSYLGLGKMSQISDINYHTLAGNANNFLRIETLRKANDTISNSIAALPIFQYWNINDTLHASDDGTKVETQIHTLNSRYSVKYFGLKKGISVLSLVCNNVPINAMTIGSHEYEGHFAFDLLANNTSDVSPAILSTDTHGANRVNFGILYFFDYIYAPRYKDTAGKIKDICGFQNLSCYEGLSIKPNHKINEQLIVSEQDNMDQRGTEIYGLRVFIG